MHATAQGALSDIVLFPYRVGPNKQDRDCRFFWVMQGPLCDRRAI